MHAERAGAIVGCHCTLAALSESAVRRASAVDGWCHALTRSGVNACRAGKGARRVPLHARGSERECSATGKCGRWMVPCIDSLWSQCMPRGQGRSSSLARRPGREARRCASTAMHNQAEARARTRGAKRRKGRHGARSHLHVRHRSPPRAAAIDATLRGRGRHCTLAALSESAVRRAGAFVRACTFAIDLRPKRRRSMPPSARAQRLVMALDAAAPAGGEWPAFHGDSGTCGQGWIPERRPFLSIHRIPDRRWADRR